MSRNLKGEVVGFLTSYSKYDFLLSFLLGFLVRLLPELLSYPNLVGFDTVYYVARLKEGVIWYHWSNFFTQTWLLYYLLIPLCMITQLSPIMILKIASPILYGLNTAGIYYFANKTLKWKTEKSLLASLLFSFSIASLRMSWDLYRNMLGLGIMLFAISLIPEIKELKRTLGFTLVSLLTVFSYELAAISLFFMVTLIVFREMIETKKGEALKIFIPLLPALTIFLLGVYLRIYPIKYEMKTNIISVRDTLDPYPLGLFFLRNYLSVSTPVEQYNTYLELILHIMSLFTLLYAIWLPLIIKGYFRDKILVTWTILLLVGSFGPLIIPHCSLLYWNRWMFMLVYPFTFYVTNGIDRAFKGRNQNEWRRTKAIMLLTIIIGVLFMTLPVAFPIPTTITYMPSSMQQNTIPLEDVDSTTECLD